ncbi:hypothetical protein TNCV_544351 [Trichonephila clavipes]|nr:hypothetical protein TNCV_544351 [Trichonephila clavipes]
MKCAVDLIWHWIPISLQRKESVIGCSTPSSHLLAALNKNQRGPTTVHDSAQMGLGLENLSPRRHPTHTQQPSLDTKV